MGICIGIDYGSISENYLVVDNVITAEAISVSLLVSSSVFRTGKLYLPEGK